MMPHEIEIARKKVGLSVEDLAVLTDLPVQTVQRLEDGRFRVRDALQVKAALIGWGYRGLKLGRGSAA